MSAGGEHDEDRVAALVEQVLERRASGEAVDLLALTGGDEAIRHRLEQALEDLERLPSMFGAGGGEDAMVGASLGDRFELEARIGAGAMGVVYRARDRVLGRDVAVKLLRAELPVGERMAARLEREAEVLAGIRDRNVITVFDRGRTDDGRAFLVMDLLRGQSLVGYLADPSLGPRQRLEHFGQLLGDVQLSRSDLRAVASWIAQACAGVQAAHDSGVLHRDIKPSNLFVERDGRVVVLDFGIGSVSSAMTLGSEGSPLGTPAYMAPEQLGDADVDARADVYGLAATLYHLVCGAAPFGGSVARVLHGVARHEPAPVDRVRPGVPRDLAAIIEKGMAKDPAGRYATAAELREDLEAWLEDRPIRARRLPAWRRGVRRAARSAGVRAAVGVLLVVAVALGVWAQNAEAARRDLRAWLAVLEHVGSSIVNDLPHTRATNGLAADVPHRQALDRLVALGVHPGVSHGLRAINRWDAGDLSGAAEDLEQVASVAAAPFSRSVARALRRGESDVAPMLGEQAPDLGSDVDRFVAALLAMRQAGAAPGWVRDVLAASDDPSLPGLADLTVLQRFRETFGMDDGLDGTLGRRAVLDEARRVQEQRGATSGILMHVRANLLLRLSRVREALQVASDARALCPGDYLFQQAHGWASLLSGQPEQALESLERATELQPSSLMAHRLRNDALRELGRLADAEEHLTQVPWQLSRFGQGWRLKQQALLEYDRGWQLLEGPDADEAAAREKFVSAGQLFVQARQVLGGGADFEELACADLAGDESAFAGILTVALATPLNADRLERLSRLLPKSVTEEEVALLARLLLFQAAALEGRDR